MASGNGHIISDLPICVDYWLKTPRENYFHFLTHLHTDHTVGLKSTFRKYIYTTDVNKWLLIKWFHIDPVQIITADYGGRISLANADESGDPIMVTFIDANHCPGSVMFLFEGDFGNILYTGDFRYTPDMLREPRLKTVVETEALHRLYLDNTYAAEHCKFPPKEELVESILEVIRSHPEHYIIIAMRKLGKEELITKIGVKLKEKVCVSQERLSLLTFLKLPQVFTTSRDDSRIYEVPMAEIEPFKINLQEEKGPVLTIIPSALFQDNSKLANHRDVFIFPYSDHSCHSELKDFVSELKPHSIYPIVSYSKIPKPYKAALGFPSNQIINPEESLRCNRIIPESILRYARRIENELTSYMQPRGQKQTNAIGLVSKNMSNRGIDTSDTSRRGIDTSDTSRSGKRERLRKAFVDGRVNTLIIDSTLLQNISNISDLMTSDESPPLNTRANMLQCDQFFVNPTNVASCEDSDSEYFPLSGDEIEKNLERQEKKLKNSSGAIDDEYVPLSQEHNTYKSGANSKGCGAQQESTNMDRIQVTPFNSEVERVLMENFNHAYSTWQLSMDSKKK